GKSATARRRTAATSAAAGAIRARSRSLIPGLPDGGTSRRAGGASGRRGGIPSADDHPAGSRRPRGTGLALCLVDAHSIATKGTGEGFMKAAVLPLAALLAALPAAPAQDYRDRDRDWRDRDWRDRDRWRYEPTDRYRRLRDYRDYEPPEVSRTYPPNYG